MNPLIKTLQGLRLLDENGTLSLTNLALIASIAKALAAPQIGWLDVAFNVATLISYQYKRYALSKTTNTKLFDARLGAVESNLNLLKSAMSIRGK